MLGHELRNPLSAIASATALMGLPSVSPEVRVRATNVIHRQTRQLTDMVDELLELSRAASGKLALDMRHHDMSAIVATCLDKLTATGATAGHTLNIQISQAFIHADAARVAGMVNHLVENALKYTPAGGSIELTLAVEDGHAVFTVRDSGIGISPILLPQLFNVFVQGATTIDRTQGGLGIGLAMVHRLSILHGGTVSARSEGAGCGSTFILQLPAATASPPCNATSAD